MEDLAVIDFSFAPPEIDYAFRMSNWKMAGITLFLTAAACLSLLVGQNDCFKAKGSGMFSGKGERYANQCNNSGFQNPCHWINCNGEVRCAYGSWCRPRPEDEGDAFNDSCWIKHPDIRCGCEYRTDCMSQV